jgi:hypothetical protein
MMNAVKVPVRVCACAAAMLAVMPAQSVTYGFRARHPAVVNPVLGEENTISLLDGMIAYAQSPAFEPKGSLK